MLSARVQIIPPVTVTAVNGLSAPLNFNCHQATCYWIYHELHGKPPMGWAFTDSSLANTTILMTKMASHGKLATPTNINGLAGGTVLIFTDPLGTAMHSCIIINAGQIGGYNQQGWFSTLGQPNQFSTHNITDIKWRQGKNNKVILPNGSKGKLYYIDEPTVITFARFNF